MKQVVNQVVGVVIGIFQIDQLYGTIKTIIRRVSYINNVLSKIKNLVLLVFPIFNFVLFIIICNNYSISAQTIFDGRLKAIIIMSYIVLILNILSALINLFISFKTKDEDDIVSEIIMLSIAVVLTIGSIIFTYHKYSTLAVGYENICTGSIGCAIDKTIYIIVFCMYLTIISTDLLIISNIIELFIKVDSVIEIVSIVVSIIIGLLSIAFFIVMKYFSNSIETLCWLTIFILGLTMVVDVLIPIGAIKKYKDN